MKPFRWDEVEGRTEEEKRYAFFHADADTYAIFQLRQDDDLRPMAFISYAQLQKRGEMPEPDHYELAYLAPLRTFQNRDTMLEELYQKFNLDRPEDFTGHSLSVSDVVALRTGRQVSFHYVDTVGFTELRDFLRLENYLKNAEISMEDDYGMIDGIINNGRAERTDPIVHEEEGSGRKSVLEELRKAREAFCEHPSANQEREFP